MMWVSFLVTACNLMYMMPPVLKYVPLTYRDTNSVISPIKIPAAPFPPIDSQSLCRVMVFGGACVYAGTHLKNVFVHVQVPPCACFILLVMVEIFLMPPLPGRLDVSESAGLEKAEILACEEGGLSRPSLCAACAILIFSLQGLLRGTEPSQLC